MPYISKYKPVGSNTTYDLKDAEARAQAAENKTNILMLEEMNGAKNLSKVSGGTRTGAGYFLTEAANTMNIAANTPVYMIFDYVIANGQSSMQLTDSDRQIISGTSIYTTEGTTSGHKVSKVIPSKNAYGFNFYSNSTGNITISNIMIVPANIYEAGFTDYQPYAMSNAELTKLTPTVKDSGNAFTTGSDYTLCDACTLTVPIPTNGIKAAHIMAGLAFNSTAPRGIIISLSNDVSDYNTSSKLLAKVESSDYIRLTAECFYYNYGGSDVNIYVWVKSSSSGVNRVVSSMQPLN